MAEIKAVIFDLDGVISDTQKYHAQVEAKLLKECGINLKAKEIIKKYAGTSDRENFEKIFKEYKKPLKKVKEILDKKYEILIGMLRGKIQPISGVIKFIKDLKDHSFKLGVASSARKKSVEFILSELKIKDDLDAIVTGEEVKFSKPNPEIYLKTAKLLNVSPKECLVIEDAVSGIRAAKAAGMKCLAITTTYLRAELNEADEIIDSFHQITVEAIKNFN
jgi:beta-phosphoglucomutase family hydrolase